MYIKLTTIKSLPAQSQYFPNLDGLRAVAALSVVLSHIEAARKHAGLTKAVNDSFMHVSGTVPVTLFFVLSGFLITALLIREKETTEKVNVKAFYIRRMLRIWPLFYFVLLIAYIAIPYFFPVTERSISITGIVLNSVFLTNVALGFNYSAPFASHLWSIGVEEQFYLSWPWVVKKVTRQNLLRAAIGIFIFVSLLKLLLHLYAYKNAFMAALSFSWGYSKFNCILTGVIIAVLIPKAGNNSVLVLTLYRYICLKATQIINISLLTILLVLNGLSYIQVPQQIYACLFAILILNMATNKQTMFQLDNRWLNYIGKISFGIYMFHYMIAEILVRTSSAFLHTKSGWLQSILIYLSVYFFTILLAHLSYRYPEAYFRKLKKNWNLTKQQHLKQTN